MFDQCHDLLNHFRHVLEAQSDHDAIPKFITALTASTSTKPIQAKLDLPVVERIPAILKNSANSSLEPLFDAVDAVYDKLTWYAFYQKNTLTESFIDEFAVADVMGPKGPIVHENAILFLFIVGPNILYPLHWHAADELYLILSGNPSFRVGEIEWHQHQPGDIIHVPSSVPHSVRVGNEPMLVVQMWHGNIHQGSLFPVSSDGTPARVMRATIED
jgi:mannose-6-phosphate isomerase-like protein (cupin superfamily)